MLSSLYKKIIGKDKVKKNIFYVPKKYALLGMGGIGSYTLSKYNPYVRQVKEFMANPGITYEGSLIRKIRERIRDLIDNNKFQKLLGKKLQVELAEYVPEEVMRETAQNRDLLYIPYRDWITADSKSKTGKKYIHSYSLDREKSREKDRENFYPKREDFFTLKSLYNSIKNNGYKPENYLTINSSYIQGDLLKKDWEFKFHIASGRHRAAVLAALDYEEIPVIFYDNRKSMNKLKTARYHHILDVRNVENWLVVENDIYPPEFAKKLFDLYFDPAEEHKASLLGMD